MKKQKKTNEAQASQNMLIRKTKWAKSTNFDKCIFENPEILKLFDTIMGEIIDTFRIERQTFNEAFVWKN